MSAQIVATGVRFSHGPIEVLSGVTMTVASGHRIGVVGPNGVGKSTLLALLAGELRPEAGTVDRVPADATIGLLRQELDLAVGETVADVIGRRTGVRAAQTELDASTEALGAGIAGADDRYADALERWLRIGAADLHHRTDAVLDRVGLGASRRDQPAHTLSGGQRSRVNLASVLLSGFDVLALDEPTNDLDLAGLELLEDFLVGTTTGLVVVSHDRAFLERVITSVVEIDGHSRTATRFEGGWSAFLEARATARRHAEQAFHTYEDRKGRLESSAQRIQEWSTAGVRTQRTGADDGDKIVRKKRMESSERLAGRARRAEKAVERLEAVDKPWEPWELRLEFADLGRPGTEVVRMRELVIDRGDFVLGPIDLDVAHGERIAVLGPNGSGKSTLLRAILGLELPTGGQVSLGPSVVAGTLDQHRLRFAGEGSLLECFTADTGVDATEARSQLAKLGMGGEHVSRPVDRLSPGERTRATLAAFALVGVNLMVLDEPTNHLDLPAIEQLESALASFSGTVLLVTHDRRFLEQVAIDRQLRLEHGTIVADEAV